MTVFHVVDVTQKLELVVHGGDDSVETVSDQCDLLVEFGIASQSIDGNSGELGEVFLDTGSLLEEPDEEERDDSVAARPDVFPAPLYISDLVGSSFSLRISQIFGFPMESKM